MKNLLCLMMIILSISVFANPIAEYVGLHELLFTEDGWQMELYTDFFDQLNLDECTVQCNSGLSLFNPGISFEMEQYLVINQDDLQTPLEFNPNNDQIYISYDNYEIARLNIGNLDNNLPPTLYGQSYALINGYDEYYYEFHYYVLDATPTIGDANTAEGTTGTFSGYVYDAENNPVANVEMAHNSLDYWDIQIITNENGFYTAEIPARNYDLHVHLGFHASLDSLVSIYPNQDNNYNFIFENYVSIDDSQIDFTENYYNLNSTPNPFYQNSGDNLKFSFSLPSITTDLTLTVYNSKGQKVKDILLENQTATKQKICAWNGKDSSGNYLASGIYLYKLSTQGKELATNKLIILK